MLFLCSLCFGCCLLYVICYEILKINWEYALLLHNISFKIVFGRWGKFSWKCFGKILDFCGFFGSWLCVGKIGHPLFLHPWIQGDSRKIFREFKRFLGFFQGFFEASLIHSKRSPILDPKNMGSPPSHCSSFDPWNFFLLCCNKLFRKISKKIKETCSKDFFIKSQRKTFYHKSFSDWKL